MGIVTEKAQVKNESNGVGRTVKPRRHGYQPRMMYFI